MRADGVRVEIFATTDTGLVRTENEDSFAIGDLDAGSATRESERLEWEVARRGPLLLLCDGMGGARGGAVASSLAVEAVWEEMATARPTDDPAVYARHLRRAIRAANLRLADAGRRDPALRGMGTTISAVGVVGGHTAVIAQVGDSRAYILRNGELVQVTRDQSVVSALVGAGVLTEEEAKQSLQRGVILQALGTAEDIDVAFSVVELRRGDLCLVCSDGLHGPVVDEAIREVVTRDASLEEIGAALVGAVHEAGAPDNVTIVLCRFAGGELKAAEEEERALGFVEFDPMEEGARAFTDTSHVARRLAHKAGLREDGSPAALPPTGQHPVIRATPQTVEELSEAGGKVSPFLIGVLIAVVVVALISVLVAIS